MSLQCQRVRINARSVALVLIQLHSLHMISRVTIVVLVSQDRVSKTRRVLITIGRDVREGS